MKANATMLTKIDSGLPVAIAATLSVNPCTAFRLLNDFTTLSSGDVIIQNGANSAVGCAVIEMARARGIKNINIIRDRHDHSEVSKKLKGLGADLVLLDSELQNPSSVKCINDIGSPILALNCVGGKSVGSMVKSLCTGSTLVTYGGMSKAPISVSSKDLIRKRITMRGFWIFLYPSSHPKPTHCDPLANKIL